MEKKTYEVAEGVEWVNGTKVPVNRRIKLTDQEAAYDLGLSRIAPLKPSRKPSKPAGEEKPEE